MGSIHVLDKHTANLIAAGEVVERPASVIKELLENSADAKADKITVEIKRGGTLLLRVTDNGVGMSGEDAPVAILRHATSKIKQSKDLEAISTLGFRGEALAAIAAVSDLRIMTRRKTDETGTLLISKDGEIISVAEAGCPAGTTIVVENLFQSFPARRKFLKRDFTEASAVLAACEKFALSRPDIALTLISDGNIKLQTPGDNSLKNAIYACLGREFASNLLPVEHTYLDVRVHGYIGRPEICRANRNLQNFFVNGRYVKSRTAAAALEQGFHSFCPAGKFPSCVLFTEIDCRFTDVNIHPAKLEIKFADEKKIFETIYFAVRGSLSDRVPPGKNSGTYSMQKTGAEETGIAIGGTGTGGGQTEKNGGIPASDHATLTESPPGTAMESLPGVLTESPPGTAMEGLPGVLTESPPGTAMEGLPGGNTRSVFPNGAGMEEMPPRGAQDLDSIVGFGVRLTGGSSFANRVRASGGMPFPPGRDQNNAPFPSRAQAVKAEDPAQQTLIGQGKKVRYIGEAFRSYLVAQTENSLYLVDKHAAHERILYESIKGAKNRGGAQMLLEPIAITLTPKEFALLIENRGYFEKSGFHFDEFGANTVLLRSHPETLEVSQIADIFTFLAGCLENANSKAAGEIFDKALFSAACKAALKAGQKNDAYHNEWILDKLFSEEAIIYCPHGRPVLIEYTKEKLDRMFGRT